MTQSQTRSSLAEQLLAAETIDGAMRAEYERKLNDMFETKLTQSKKLMFVALIITSVVAGGIAATLALTESVPPRVRTALLCGAGFAVAWTVYFVRLLIRGVYRRRIDAPLAAGMAFGFSLTMCILMTIAGVKPEHVLLMSIVTVLPASLVLLHSVIRQSELRTQEQLVRLEYKIAKLTERLGDDDGNTSAGVLR